MAKPAGSIAIESGQRVGKPYAVFVEHGAGDLARCDFATLAAARAFARDVTGRTEWPISEDLQRDRYAELMAERAAARA